MTDEERRIRLAQLAEERKRIEAQRQARMNMLGLGRDYYDEQFDASLPPMLTGVNLAEKQNNGVQIDESGNPVLPPQFSSIPPDQRAPQFPSQRPSGSNISLLSPQIPNFNVPDVQTINPQPPTLADNATQFANNVINRRNNRISNQGIDVSQGAGINFPNQSQSNNQQQSAPSFPNILDAVQSYQNQQNQVPVNRVAENGPIAGSIDPRSPNQYMSAMEAAGRGQGQITDQMGLKPGGGIGLQSDLIDYAKDGSGDVLYNGQNTGIKADELNAAQQRLSGDYGSQDHYQKTFGNQEFLLALAIGLNSLSTFPNQQWGQYLQGQMEGIQKRKNAIDGANWLLSKGRKDLAEAVATGALDFDKAYAEFVKKPEETFRELTAAEYKEIGHDPLTGGRIQVSDTTNKRLGGPYSKSTAPTVNVSVGEKGIGKGYEEMGKEFAPGDVKLIDDAEKAVGRISSLNNTADAIVRGAVSGGKEGFETGPFAEFRKGVDAFLVGFGSRDKARVSRLSDAELINATLGADVFGAIGELGIGARGLDTPAEREFLRQVLTGTIETTPAALLYMTYIRQKIQRRVIDTYNKRLESNVYGPFKEQRGLQNIEQPSSIFVDEKGKLKEFNSYTEMQDWLENKKAQYSESKTTQGVGTVTKDGVEYEIEEIQ